MKLKDRKILKKIKKFIKDDEIIAIHGSRQVGKTSLLYLIIEKHLKNTKQENIFFFDLEDFFLLDLCNQGPEQVINYLKGKGADFKNKVYLFIDEVQYLDSPSSFLKLFYDKFKGKIKLIVSGSSSFLIKKKFKDSLVGRIIDFELFTLDFEEFLNFKELNYDLRFLSDAINRELLPLYKEYLIYGGYPAIVIEEDIEKKEIKLKQIINTYVKKDVRDLAAIRNINKFNALLSVLSSQSGRLLNITELSNTLGIAKKTIEDYLLILENTYIIKRIYPFYKNIRSELTKMPKIFFEDTGMMNILMNKSFPSVITGEMFETGLYSIFRKNIEVDNIHFWRTNKGQEVDFVLNFPKKKTPIIPLEVKLNYSKKYLTPLRYFLDKYNLKMGFLVCSKERISPDKRIKVIYPWQFYQMFKDYF